MEFLAAFTCLKWSMTYFRMRDDWGLSEGGRGGMHSSPMSLSFQALKRASLMLFIATMYVNRTNEQGASGSDERSSASVVAEFQFCLFTSYTC